MGGAVSTGEDNDDLIDNLVEADCIKTPSVEAIFRAVDRADYYLKKHRDGAYKDVAWKQGNLHLSAPCIYSEVMEALKLEPGLSFLNAGSGTGYISTMAGLILGSYGVNHGIELFEDVVNHAYDFLEQFKKNSLALDRYDFCEPQYFCGNVLLLDPTTKLYDRVYCGAGCPPELENFFKNLLKIGGILVIPTRDFLWEITRKSQVDWQVIKLLSVTFASLVLPRSDEENQTIHIDAPKPLKLAAICRHNIRNCLRQKIEHKNPRLKRKLPPRKKRRKIQKVVLPVVPEPNTFYSTDEATGVDENGADGNFDQRYSLFSLMNPANSQNPPRDDLSPGHSHSECSDVSGFLQSHLIRTSFKPSSSDNNEISDGTSDDCDDLPLEKMVKEPRADNLSDIDAPSGVAPASNSEDEQKAASTSASRTSHIQKLFWRCNDPSSSMDSDSDEKSENPGKRQHPESHSHFTTSSYSSSYSKHMISHIKKLPLPNALKKYVNYDRDL